MLILIILKKKQELMNKIDSLDLNLRDEKTTTKRQTDNLLSETDKLNDIIKEHKRTVEMLRSEILSKEEFFRSAKTKWEHEKHVLEHELTNLKVHLHKSFQSNQKQILEEELLVTRASLQHQKDAFQLERSSLFKQVLSSFSI